MFPEFTGPSSRRPMNLGGAQSSHYSGSLLDAAKQRRNERMQAKAREDSARSIQRAWIGTRQRWAVQEQLLQEFYALTSTSNDVDMDDFGLDHTRPDKNLTAMRYLVLLGKNEEALAAWSRGFAQRPQNLAQLNETDSKSYVVLLKQISLLLFRSVSLHPSSTNVLSHLAVLGQLLSPSFAASSEITAYILEKDFYALIGSAITFHVDASNPKTSAYLPLLIPLATNPLLIFSADVQVIQQFLVHILTIPSLPARLPISTLTKLTTHIPYSTLSLLPSVDKFISQLNVLSRIHLIANLVAFIGPRYAVVAGKPTSKVTPNVPATAAYLELLIALINSVPIGTFEPRKPKAAVHDLHVSAQQNDSDSDDDGIHIDIVSTFETKVVEEPVPVLDARTYKRLQSLVSPAHVYSLLRFANSSVPAKSNLKPRETVITLLLALTVVYPSDKDRLLTNILVSGGGAGLVRELWRGYVRGREGQLGLGFGGGDSSEIEQSDAWACLLFLSDLYAQTLLTMGDDEFFGEDTADSSRSKGKQVQQQPKNPMSTDDLKTFSAMLMRVAFAMFWREGGSNVNAMVVDSDTTAKSSNGPTSRLRISWQGARDKIIKCMVAIHARDSRKPFLPKEHWLISSTATLSGGTTPVDLTSFVDAAIYEEQMLSNATSDIPVPATRRNRPQASNRHILASFSPRLGILNNIPFAIPFSTRVSIFRHFVANDMVASGRVANRGGHGWMMDGSRGRRTKIQVRRNNVSQDGFDKLQEADLKAPVEIEFIDQFGAVETGIDGGGLFKEFFTSLCREVFDSDRGLWLANTREELYPNPHAYATETHSLNWYRFIGRILGKAMYEGILVDVAFAGFFLAKWLGKQSFLDDLASLDPELYNGLIFLKHYQGNVEDLSLNFTVAIDEFGVTRTVNLIPDGLNVAVTQENRLQYIALISHYRLSKQIRAQSAAFFEGLSEMIDSKWLRMFNQQEVQILLGGTNSPIDIEDLRSHTIYGGVYDDQEETITLFWDVFETFNMEERRALLRFVTSCSRPPLLGFKELVPQLSIRDAGNDESRLPTASTCVNLLKLPRYKTKEGLRAKLLQAIMSGAGFDLS